MFFQFLTVVFVVFVQVGLMAQDSEDVVDLEKNANALDSSARLKADQGDIKKELKGNQQTLPISNSQVEKLQVTGSYVRRIDVEGPTPLTVWDKEDFEVAGVNTISDYMRESPLFQQSDDSGNRDGYFRFRGQHAGSTLILINGMRLPTLGGPGRGFYTGVENIPTNIIERVEILKDGSSALYGSDAMAGVMNFITKKDYDGAEFSTRVTAPEAGFGLEQNHTMSFGKSYSKGSWFVSSQYMEQRGYNQADIGNYHNVPTVGPSTYGNVKYFGNDKDSESVTIGGCRGIEDCEVDGTTLDFVRDPRENLGNLITGRYEITPDINVSVLGMYNRRRRKDIGRPFFINQTRESGAAPFNASQFGGQELGLNQAGHPFAEFSANPVDEIGPREIDILQNSYSAQTMIEGFVGDTWRWDLSGSYAYSLEERDHINGLVNQAAIPGLIDQKIWNPLNAGDPRNIGAFDGIGVRGTEAYEASQTMARFVTSGELFELSDLYSDGGPVSIAMGLEGQWETTADAHDRILIENDLNQVFGENQSGSRGVTSVFTELVMYPLDNLELQLAGRYDRYSDWGETINPKLSLGYRPSNKVLLRSSIGTNFNAPSLRNMIERDRLANEFLSVCEEGTSKCKSINTPVRRYRDEGLQPEVGVNYNFGAILQPNKNWTFTFDQWNFDGSQTLAAISLDQYSEIGNAIGDEGLADAGVTFDYDSNGQIIGARAPSVTNTGTKTIRGIDLGFRFDSPIKLFSKVLKFGLSMDHSHILVQGDRRTPLAPIIYRQDLEWQNTIRFFFTTQRHAYQVAARTLPGDTTLTSRGSTRTHTEYDLNYSYGFPWSGRFTFGVKNLLNTGTPTNLATNFVNFNSSFNSYAFLPLGRRYYVGYSHSF